MDKESEITLVDLIGLNVATKQQEKVGVYCVTVNGLRMATIGWSSNLLQFNSRLGPIEATRIQKTVNQLLERECVVQFPPDVPIEFLNPEESTDDSDDSDDFDS